MTDLFELDGDFVVAFLGSWGDRGCYAWRGDRWDYVPREHLQWDAWHQSVYRNHRGRRVDATELASRGVPLPPDEPPRGAPTSVDWSAQFDAEMPLASVPPRVLEALRAAAEPVTVLLFEDRYETSFGDGKFVYPREAFLSREAALRRLADLEAEVPEYSWSRKEVPLVVDTAAGVLRADLRLERYERLGLADVVRLLGASA